VTLFHTHATTSASAPGRVNLMGDHTDYNGGYVLPMPMPQRTYVELAKRDDGMVRLWSADVEHVQAWCEYRLGAETRRGNWTDYVQGTTWALRGQGHRIGGCDVRVESSLPLGGGLSSSASLMIALLRALRNTFAPAISDRALAELAYRAETEFVGAPVGVMDHLVCALGRPRQAFFLDTARLEYEFVDLPPDIDWIVMHSGVRHHHTTGSYRLRREECQRINHLLGVRWMRDLEGAGRQAVLAQVDELPAPLNRRARHVVTENERVLTAVEFMRNGRAEALGALMTMSHESLRRDFEVSVSDVDALVELALADPTVFGARMTGGGFGGSVVVAVRTGAGSAVAGELAARYERETGRSAAILLPETVPTEVRAA